MDSSLCSSAKEMWDELEVTHEGTEKVKRARKNNLIQEYEMFRMLPLENIYDIQKEVHSYSKLPSFSWKDFW